MTHPSEKKDQTDALEKALVDDADTHRDPSASETPTTCKRCGDEYRLRDDCEPTPYCDSCAHNMVDLLQTEFSALRTKLAEVERELAKADSTIIYLRGNLTEVERERDEKDTVPRSRYYAACDQYNDKANELTQVRAVAIKELRAVETRLQHSESVRAELAAGLESLTSNIDQGSLDLGCAMIFEKAKAALARHCAAPAEKEGQS